MPALAEKLREIYRRREPPEREAYLETLRGVLEVLGTEPGTVRPADPDGRPGRDRPAGPRASHHHRARHPRPDGFPPQRAGLQGRGGQQDHRPAGRGTGPGRVPGGRCALGGPRGAALAHGTGRVPGGIQGPREHGRGDAGEPRRDGHGHGAEALLPAALPLPQGQPREHHQRDGQRQLPLPEVRPRRHHDPRVHGAVLRRRGRDGLRPVREGSPAPRGGAGIPHLPRGTGVVLRP